MLEKVEFNLAVALSRLAVYALYVHTPETFDVAANEVPKTSEEEEAIYKIVKVCKHVRATAQVFQSRPVKSMIDIPLSLS